MDRPAASRRTRTVLPAAGRAGRSTSHGPAARPELGETVTWRPPGELVGCCRAQGGVHLPDQDLAGCGGTEAALSGSGKTGGVPRVEQARSFKVHLAPGDVNVNERRIRDGN